MLVMRKYLLSFLLIASMFAGNDIGAVQKKIERDYNKGYSKQDKKIISWIVKTIAWDNLLKLAPKKDLLKEEGKKVDHVHPLRFCEVIFANEELKCGAHAIRDRTSWVRDPFYNGITGSLEEESACNNLKIEYIQDFAKNVKIDSGIILPILQQKRWVDFVNCLIDNIPRENDPHRYNM